MIDLRYYCCLISLLATSCATHAPRHVDPNQNPHLHAESQPRLKSDLPQRLGLHPQSTQTPPVPGLPSSLTIQSPAKEKRLPVFNLVVNEAPVKEVLFGLAKESGVNLDIHPALQGYVTLHAVQQTLPAILERMSKQVDMHYEQINDVWMVAPDKPIIKNYHIDYVNLSRETKGYIGAAAEISSTGQTAVSSANSNMTTTVSNGNGSANSSRTAVQSAAKHYLWESVIANVRAILEETDKEVVINRYGTARDDREQKVVTTSIEANNKSREILEQGRNEYKIWMASQVIANPETGILAIRATKRQHQQVKAFLDLVMNAAKRQVLIEATIVEVGLNDSFQMGIDWSRINAAGQKSGVVVGQSLGSQSARFSTNTGLWVPNNTKNALGIDNGTAGWLVGYINPSSALGNISASVNLLQQFGETRVLSSPKLMVLNNQTAVLKVVDNLVYFTIQSQISQNTSPSGSNVQSVTTIANTVPVGLIMAVTPQISQLKQINLDVRPTISKVIRYVDDPNPQLGTGPSRVKSSVPEIQVREMESVLNVQSGQIAVLGGLMQDDKVDSIDKVPGLSQIPLLGRVFTGQSRAKRKTELVVFLRATQIQQPDVLAGDLQAMAPYLPNQEQMEPSITSE